MDRIAVTSQILEARCQQFNKACAVMEDGPEKDRLPDEIDDVSEINIRLHRYELGQNLDVRVTVQKKTKI